MIKLMLIIVGIVFVIGIVGAFTGVIDVDFDEKVLSISTDKICSAELLSNVLDKQCDKDTSRIVPVDENIISITKSKEGVIRVKNG